MQSSRAAVVEEGSFNDLEISVALPPPDAFTPSIPVSLIIKAIIGLYVVIRSPQLGGMRIQNIRRSLTTKGPRMVLGILAIILMRDNGSFISEKLGIGRIHQERLVNGLTLLTPLMFLSGSVSEMRPELAIVGSSPHDAESGVTRQTSSDFIGRFLLLESLASLGLVFLPLFDIESRLKALVRRFAPRLLDDEETCSSCSSSTIVLPHICTPCGDVYCYYCVKSETLPFRCYRCHKKVSSFAPRKFHFPS